MQCPGLAGLWRTCPDQLVGLRPFEQQALMAVAMPLVIVLLVLVLTLLTVIVFAVTDGIPLGIVRRTVDLHAVRAERLEQARRHLLRTRRAGTVHGRQWAEGPADAHTGLSPAAVAPFAWRRAADDGRANLLARARRVLEVASSGASAAADHGVDVLLRSLDATGRRVAPSIARAVAVSATRRWLLPSIAGSVHATALVATAASPSPGLPTGPGGSSAGAEPAGPPAQTLDGRRSTVDPALVDRALTRPRRHANGGESAPRSPASRGAGRSGRRTAGAPRRGSTMPVPASVHPPARSRG